MIFKSSFVGSPDVAVVISGVSVDYASITSVSVDITENNHDMAVITFAGLIPKAITEYVGAPVYISVATSPSQICSFYGYVAYTAPEAYTRRGLVNNSPFQSARVVCFGASYDMKAQKNKAWNSVSLLDVVSTLADTYKYSYSIPEDSFVWPRIIQTKQSDWSLLEYAVDSLGYDMTVNGTHIHIYDSYKAISRKLPYVELKTVRGAEGSPQYVPGAIMEFDGTFGDVTPDGSSNNYKLTGLDNFGKIVNTDDIKEWSEFGEKVESRFTHELTYNTNSVEMLNRISKSIHKKYYPYNANVTVTGTVDALPGSVTKVDNYASQFDGYWVVKKVKHLVTRSNFVTELKIATDSTNISPPVVSAGSAYQEPPTPKLSTDSRWESSREYKNVYI
jgi:hypothetical protein